MKKKSILALFMAVLMTCSFALNACKPKPRETEFGTKWNQNFVPDDGKVWMFAGQDLGAVGGLTDYTEGYSDYFGVPAGITTYTNMNLQGLTETANWGSGDLNAKKYVDSAAYDNALIAIGLWCPGDDLDAIIAGDKDTELTALASFMKGATGHNFFLRIGYEFDYTGNNYPQTKYIAAYKYIVTKLKANNATNFVSVWQSCGFEGSDLNAEKQRLLGWYPGDEYVDWVAYSYFNANAYTGSAMRAIARDKGKPCFIAEATPFGYNLESQNGVSQWNGWFKNFIDHVKANVSVIRAVSYINQDWDKQVQWSGQGWGNSKLQADAYIRSKWAAEITSKDNIFVHKKVNVNENKTYVPEVYVEPVAPAGTGTLIEAEWGKIIGAATVDDTRDESGIKAVNLTAASDKIELFGLPSGKSLSILYSAASAGKFTVTIGAEQYEYDYTATDGYELAGITDSGDKAVELSQNEQVTIKASTAAKVDAVYVLPSADHMLRLWGEETDVADAVLGGDSSIYDIDIASSGKAATLSKTDGSGVGSLTFTAATAGNAVAIVFAKGPGVAAVGQTPLYIKGSKVPFTHTTSGDWNAFQAYIVKADIAVGDIIKLDRESTANQAVNIDGIFIFDLGIFDGSVEIGEMSEPVEVIPYTDTELTNNMALLGNGLAVNPDDNSVTLESAGDRIGWFALPSFNNAKLVYSVDTDTTLDVYSSGLKIATLNLKASTEVNAVRIVTAIGGFVSPGANITFRLEDATTGVKIYKLILGCVGDYNDAAPELGSNASLQWKGANGGGDYPLHEYFADGQQLTFTANGDFDTLAFVGTTGSGAALRLTVGGEDFEVPFITSSWTLFKVAYLNLGKTIADGDTVTVTVAGGINLNAVYGLNYADFSNEPQEAFIPFGTKLYPSMVDSGLSNGAALSEGESITWHNLSSFYGGWIVYSADSAGTIGLYFNNGPRQEIQVSATPSGQTYLVVEMLNSYFAPANGSIRIAVESGDVNVTIKQVVLGGVGYGGNSPAMPANATEVWGGANAGSGDYPKHSNFNNASFSFTVSADTDTLAFIAATESGAVFTIEINGVEFAVGSISGDWQVFNVAYLYFGQTIPAGTQITVTVSGNINVNSVHALSISDFVAAA